MPTITTRGILFLSSYSPLALIFCMLLWGHWWIMGALLALSALSLLTLWLYFRRARSFGQHHQKVTHVELRDSDVMGYIASYLIPFVTFSLTAWPQVVALLLFIGVLMVVYINSNMIYINPVLNLAGYRLYEVEIERSTQPHFYIARKRVVLNEEIRFVQLSDDIYLEM